MKFSKKGFKILKVMGKVMLPSACRGRQKEVMAGVQMISEKASIYKDFSLYKTEYLQKFSINFISFLLVSHSLFLINLLIT